MILFICSQKIISGGNLVLKNYIESLRGKFEIGILIPDDPKMIDFYGQTNINVFTSSHLKMLSHIKVKVWKYFVKVYTTIVACFQIVNIARRQKVKVAVINNIGDVIYAPALKLVGVSVVYFFHEVPHFSPVRDLAIRICTKFCSNIVAVAETVKDDLATNLQIDEKKISVIYNGVDLIDRQIQSKVLVGKIRFFFSGTITNRKNPLYFIQIVSALSKRFNVKADIFFHQAEPELLKAVRDSIAQTGLDIELYEDLPRAEYLNRIRSYHFLLSTSRTEALSISFLECISRGIPVICTDVGGNSEIVQSFENGLLFKSVDEIDAFLDRVLSENGFYDKLQKNCLRLAHEKFASDSSNRKLEEILLKNSPQRNPEVFR